MNHSTLLITASILLGSVAIATSIYTSPSEQLAREKLACSKNNGTVRYEPGSGLVDGKMTEQCKMLLGTQVEASIDGSVRTILNWP